jgi:hypothetical protein
VTPYMVELACGPADEHSKMKDVKILIWGDNLRAAFGYDSQLGNWNLMVVGRRSYPTGKLQTFYLSNPLWTHVLPCAVPLVEANGPR